MRAGGLFKVRFTARSHLLAQGAKYAKSIIFSFAGQSANEKLHCFVHTERLAKSQVPIGLGLKNLHGCFCFSVSPKSKRKYNLSALRVLAVKTPGSFRAKYHATRFTGGG
jgi:hypothetical protein